MFKKILVVAAICLAIAMMAGHNAGAHKPKPQCSGQVLLLAYDCYENLLKMQEMEDALHSGLQREFQKYTMEQWLWWKGMDAECEVLFQVFPEIEAVCYEQYKKSRHKRP